MDLPPLYVLRHGETEWNAQGRLQGRANSPLTEQGRAQAMRQGALLGHLDLRAFDLFVSPQMRALQTLALAFSHTADQAQTDARLREIDVGDWTGRKRDELSATGEVTEEVPDGGLALYAFAPNGESFGDLRVRCRDFLASLRGPTICVTHGITSRMLRAVALDLPTAVLGDLPGGQGVVHVVENGAHHTLETGLAPAGSNALKGVQSGD